VLLLVGAATLGLAAAEKPSPSPGDGRGVAPSFLFFSPHRSLEETTLGIAAIDFRNRAYRLPGDGEGAAPAEIPLQDGRYAKSGEGAPSETVEISEIRYYPAGSVPAQLAIVFLTRVRAGGSSSCDGIVQLFGVSEGHLMMHHQVTYNCHGESGARVSESGEDLEIRSVAFAPGDAHCCPSFQDLAAFKIGAEEMKLFRWERRPYPKAGR
jgi:hypothetical protein